MKRLAFIVIVLVGMTGAFHWLSESFSSQWESQMRISLEKAASRTTQTQVSIDSIALTFFHRVRLLNVRMVDPRDPSKPVFQAGEIELTLSVIDLPRAILRRKPLEAIGLVSVKNPWVRISREFLDRHTTGNKRNGPMPLWFTLAWEGGSFQWVDPSIPHGVLTLYQTNGVFRIRGPQTSFAMRAGIQEAESIRLQFASLGERWNAQGKVSSANASGILTLIQSLANRSILPKGWSLRGKMDFSAEASGRRRPNSREDWRRYLDQAVLSMTSEGAPKKGDREVGLTGTLTYKAGKMTSPRLMIQTGAFEGTGSVDVLVGNIHPEPDISIHAQFPSGHLGPWPFQNAVIRTRYIRKHWELQENTLRFLDGDISAKGYASASDSRVTFTAQNMSLAALFPDSGAHVPQGRVSASASFSGPFHQWETAGSWWLSGVQWGTSSIGDARGDFELTPTHFEAKAKSDDSRFRFVSEANLSKDRMILDRMEFFLPSGAAFSAEARVSRATQKLEGTLEASGILVPKDIPLAIFEGRAVQGVLSLTSRLNGTLENPVVKGTAIIPDLEFSHESIGKASAQFVWTRSTLDIPSFRTETGIEGRCHFEQGLQEQWSLDLNLKKAPALLLEVLSSQPFSTQGTLDGRLHLEKKTDYLGNGSLRIEDSFLGKTEVPRAAVAFDLKANHMQVHEFSLEMPQARVSGEGRAHWTPGKKGPENFSFEGKGHARSPKDAPIPWEAPFVMVGRLMPSTEGWQGEARVSSKRPLLRSIQVEPVETLLRWGSRQLSWSDTRWGSRWTSKGSLSWKKEPATLSATIQADRVLLQDWQPILFPAIKERFQGMLEGTWTLSGPAADLQCALALHAEDVRWRAFQFSGDLSGILNREGIKPLNLKGLIQSGGGFLFNGLLTADKKTQGTLKLTAVNLRPLGESLGFPRSLQGLANATLTVNGPLSDLRSSGHLEGGPFVYGAETDHPLRIEQMAADMTLAPSESDASIERLTLTEAQIKTAEELIRFQSGSFLEFAGKNPAHLRLGTDVRNLHLGIFTLFGGLDVAGIWQIKPEGFAIQTRSQTHSLFINDYELQEGIVQADYYNGLLSFTAPSENPGLITGKVDFRRAPELEFTDFFISGRDRAGMELSGKIGPSLWDFKMAGRQLDMGTLGELAGFPYPLSGTADIRVRGAGDPKHPHVDGRIELSRGTALGLAYRTGAASFVWQDTRITFSRLSLSNPDRYHLEGAGSFPLMQRNKAGTGSADHSIDFSVRLQDSNLGLLQSLSPEIKSAKGDVEGLIQLKGTVENPSFHGSVRVTDGEVVGAHYFRHLRGAFLTVDLDGDHILIRDLGGRSGEGEFRGSGIITLSGFEPSFYDLKMDIVSSKGVEVQVPELAIPESPLAKRFRFLTSASRADVRGHVTLKGPAEAPVFSGEGLFSNGHFTFPPSRKNPPDPKVMEWFRRITWDVNLRFLDSAWFDNELVQVLVSGNLKLKGPSEKLRVDGGLDITEGKFSYLGLQFDVRQGRFDIRSEVNSESVVNLPYVRGVAESQVQAVDTVSGISGAAGGSRLSINDIVTLTIDYAPVDQIKPRLTSASNPTMSQDKLLARVTQTDVENLTPQERTYLYQKQLVSLIDNSLTTPLAQNVLKKTGLADRVRVQHVFDPNSVAAQDLNSARQAQQQTTGPSIFANTKYTVEKDFSDRLSLGYGVRFIPTASVDPAVTQQQKLDLVSDVQLSYRWFRNVYLKGDFDLPNTNPNILPERKVTIEPRWRFGWWGNTNKEKQKPTK